MKKRKNKASLRVIPLGGLEEIGKNMTAYEFGDDIIVVDCGLAFPEDELLGIDVVIPDISYLTENADKLRALFITHAHEDHIGAIPYFLMELTPPIYASKFTLGVIAAKLKEFGISGNLNAISPREKIRAGVFEVEPIRVNHSTPDSVSFAIDSPVGKVVHTGDFKIDHSPIDGEKTDLARFAALGEEGVKLLLSDSTNATNPGYTMSESTVGETFDDLFRNEAMNRIIVASFASNVHRIQQIINSADKFGRKVALAGRSMLNITNVARTLGYLNIPKGLLIDIKDINSYPDYELAIITTGSQGEAMAGLTRMANGSHKNIKVKENDLVIFSSTPIPGNEKSVHKVINMLVQRGANVIYEALEEVHVSGHAKSEELKLMLALTKPEFFVPVHGEILHMAAHKQLAVGTGTPEENIFFMQNGDVLEISGSGAHMAEPIVSGRIFVDGLGVGDIGTTVLRERKRLSEDGIIIVTLVVDKARNAVVGGPYIETKGFIYMDESEDLVLDITNRVEGEIHKRKIKSRSDIHALKNSIQDSLNKFIYRRTKRGPMVLTLCVEMDQLWGRDGN